MLIYTTRILIFSYRLYSRGGQSQISPPLGANEFYVINPEKEQKKNKRNLIDFSLRGASPQASPPQSRDQKNLNKP